MSLAICTRRPPSVLQLTKRRLSSSTPSTKASSSRSAKASSSGSVNSHSSMPPAQQRALIALYHQAETWVTPENLMQRIDDAFVPRESTDKFDTTKIDLLRSRSDISWEELAKAERAMSQAPKVAQWDVGAPLKMQHELMAQDNWAAYRTKRESKVIEALYGVVAAPGATLLPGLEVVQELAKKADESQALAEEEYTR